MRETERDRVSRGNYVNKCMYCTNRIGATEILMAGHNRQDQH